MYRKIALLIGVITLLGFLGAGRALAGAVQLAQTGQTKCHDAFGVEIACAGSGQDGEYRAGVPWPTPRFVAGTGTEAECVTDKLTGLMWSKNGNLPNGGKKWTDALVYANNLTLCGYSDWRLPNINEMESLVNADVPKPSDWLTSQGFTNVQSQLYWTSSTYMVQYAWADAWELSLETGLVSYWMKSNYKFVWPVRGGLSGSTAPAALWKTGQTACYDEYANQVACAGTGQDGDIQAGVAWPSPRFSDRGNGTVTDNLTGLMWTKDACAPGPSQCTPGCNPAQKMWWQTALGYMQCLNTAAYLGYTDWRLPNRTEMRSLVDYSRAYPFLQTGHPFTNPFSDWYLSSTTYAYETGASWNLAMWDGVVENQFKGHPIWPWPVRGRSYAEPALSVSKSGTGQGTVSSVPSGINCGAACSAKFTQGVAVTLTATRSTGSVFSGWSGGCTGTSTTCKVTMTDDITVSATFTVATYDVTATATGSGTVSPSTQKITHGATASITITPSANYEVSAITDNGTARPITNPYMITNVTAPHKVAVTFVASPMLYVGKKGNGAGTITSAPAGINCGTTCSKGFIHSSIVTLTATAATGSTFTGWSGVCTGTGACSVIMSSAKYVYATFTLQQFAVTASAPGGHGTAAPASQTINYGGTASIALTPAAGYGVSAITDNNTSKPIANPYKITNVTAPHTVAVAFAPLYALTVSKSGTGTGSIASSPTGINCGATCTTKFAQGAVVTLTATPAATSTFTGWSGGGCTGTGTCKVTINNALTITAAFTIKQFAITASVAGGHGKVNPASKTVTYGASATIAITPDTGYRVATITDNGVTKPVATSYTITNVTAAHNVIVTFKPAS